MNYFELHKELEELFEQKGIIEIADIDWIMVQVLGISRGKLPFVKDISLSDEQTIKKIATLRATHKPLAYILGESNFFGRDFAVNNNVLIPRMDTEVLIETIIKECQHFDKNKTILDIGTGSGAIIITLALELGANCIGVDINEDALAVAKTNAKKLGADVQFFKSNLFENLKSEKFDIIVSNPPYIETAKINELDAEVKDFEPHLALDGGLKGLDFYEKIVRDAKYFLNKNGMLFFEIGYNQANDVSKLMEKDFEDIKVVKDYGGNDRVVFGKLR